MARQGARCQASALVLLLLLSTSSRARAAEPGVANGGGASDNPQLRAPRPDLPPALPEPSLGPPHQQHQEAPSMQLDGAGWLALDAPSTRPPHKALLLAAMAAVLFLAAGGGIGGGAVFVPLLCVVGGYAAPQAVALSNVTIMGGALANFLANSRRRHATLDRPLIDWDLICVMEPTTMLGALLGGYLNKLLPGWLTSCLLAGLLLVLTWKLLRRGALAFAAESRLARQQAWAGAGKQAQRGSGGSELAGSDLRAPLLAGADGYGEADAGKGGAWLADAAAEADDVRPVLDCGAGEQQVVPVHAVLPVPAGLRPLSIAGRAQPDQCRRDQQQEQQEQQEEQQQQQRQQQQAPLLGLDQQQQAGDHQALLVRPGPALPQPPMQPPDSGVLLLERQQQALADSLRLGAAQARSRARRLRSRGRGSTGPPAWPCCSCSCFDARRLSLAAVQAYERQQLPWQPVALLSGLSLLLVASDTAKAALACGSPAYWLVVLSVVPPVALVTLAVRRWLLAATAVKAQAAAALACTEAWALPAPLEATSPPRAAAGPASAAAAAAAMTSSGVRWTPRTTLLYPMLCSVAGVFAGLFGVGGGIIKGPLLLELRVCPEVAAATSATMIAFTSGSAAIVFYNFGRFADVGDLALTLLALGFCVTLLGQLVTTRLVRALGRRSLIVFAMALLMALASAGAAYQSGLAVAQAAASDTWWAWGSVCRHS